MLALCKRFERDWPVGELTIKWLPHDHVWFAEAKCGDALCCSVTNRNPEEALRLCMDQVKLWR